MNTKKIGGLIVAGTLALFVAAQPSAATGGLAGIAEATFPFCPPGSDKLVIAGVEDAGIWTIAVGDANAGMLGCAIADVYDASGAWDPAVGHNFTSFANCMSGAVIGGFLCLGPVPLTGTPTATPLFACGPIAGCVSGTATLVRA